jgi:hypothetical protein
MAPVYNHMQGYEVGDNPILMKEYHLPLIYYIMIAFTSSGISFKCFLILMLLIAIIEFTGFYYSVYNPST